MKTTTTIVRQTTGCATSSRLRAAALAPSYATGRRAASAPLAINGINGPIAGSWLDDTRKSMTVPSFHDRWPLCSAT